MSTFKDLINGSIPVVVHFTAEWAKPSELLADRLKEIKQQLGEQVKMIKIDVDKNPDVASKFSIVGVPSMLLFKQSSIKWRHTGLIEIQDLIEEIEKHQ